MNQLIRCKICDQIFMKSPYDKYPEYTFGPDRSRGDFHSIERDDFKDFLSHHRGHQLESLEIIEDSFVSERAYFEPINTSFFRATNGKEKFVIKKYRERIDEPLKYELVSGDYCLRCIGVKTQSKEILRQLGREIKPPLSQDKISAFLMLIDAVVEGIDIKNLERIPEESHHPLEAYYKIDDVHIMFLLRNCRRIFKEQEYLAMEEFIHRHKDDGVMLLKATYEIQVTQMGKAKERSTRPALSFEKEIIFRKK